LRSGHKAISICPTYMNKHMQRKINKEYIKYFAASMATPTIK
jgi:hypothetical protein